MTISRSNVLQKLRFAPAYFLLIAGLAVGVIAQESPQSAKLPQQATEANPPSDTSVGQPDSSLRIGAGDLLEFSVYNVPELSTKTRISSNGDAYLPLIDYVHVGGLTAEEAQAVVEKKLYDGGF